MSSSGLGPTIGRPRRTLRGRLVTAFLGVSLVTIALLGSVAFLRARHNLERLTFERLESVAEVDEGVLNRWVSTQEREIRFLAELPQLQRATARIAELPDDSERREAIVANVQSLLETSQAHSDLAEIFIMSPRGGEVVVATRAARVGDYFVDALFFIEGRHDAFVQNLYPSPTTSQPTITAAAPVLDEEGRTIAVVAGHLNLERIDRMLATRTGLGDTAEVYLVSAFNDFVSAERFGRAGHRRGVHSEGVKLAIDGRAGVGLYDNYRGAPVIGAYRWIEERELALLVEMEQSEAFAPARSLATTIVGTGLVSILLLTWGVTWVAKQITQPLDSLSEAAHRVADGDFSPVAPVMSDDEVGALAAIFNQMTGKLRVLYTDLTEQVQQTQAARDEAEFATRAKSEFLARMSHEIRTPLNAVLGMAHLLQKTRLDDAQRDYATKIRSSGQHLLTVINEILDFSKLEAQGIQLEAIEFRLEDVFDRLNALVPQARESVEVVFQIDPEVPERLVGDSLRLGQVLSNLLSNAVKFTHEGEIHVRASLASDNGESATVRFEVRDTGIGVEASDTRSLFDAFSQQDESTTRRYGGTGLGLSICRQLVGLMGGTIDAEGAPGAGSRFWFTAQFGMPESPETERPSSLNGVRLAVALTNVTLRAAVESMVAARGASLAAGPEAPEGVDAVIVDWDLARSAPSTTPVGIPRVVLARAQQIVEATARRWPAGTTRVIAKPVTPKSLEESLGVVLAAGPAVSSSSTPRHTLAGIRVLVVEDNFINQEIAREVLAAAGALVSVASNGQRGLDQLEAGPVDLVLLDIQMPDMSGWEVAERIHSRMGEDRPAIVVLSADPQHDRRKLVERYVDDSVTKPFEPEHLLTVIARTVGGESVSETQILDRRSGRERAAGNDELYQELLHMFLDSQREVVAEAKAELEGGAAEALDRRLHNLKGVAGNLGALEVASVAERALGACRAGHLNAGTLDELGAALVRLEDVIGSDSKDSENEPRETRDDRALEVALS